MKIVIIGAHEKQVRLMGDFPYLDIRCANKEAHHGAGESALYKNADRLLVMTKFISHGLFDKLDRDKVIYVNGGITRARDILTTLNAVARIARQPVTTAQEDEEDMAARNTFDFKPLRFAKVGEQFTFDKPDDLSVLAFKLSMEQGRSYYKRTYGVLSKQEVTGGGNKAVVTVTGIAEVETPKQAAYVPAAVETFRPAPVDEEPASADAELERRWWDVILAAMHTRPTHQAYEHVAAANVVVDAFVARFRA